MNEYVPVSDLQRQAIKMIIHLTGSTVYGLCAGAGVRAVNEINLLMYDEAIEVIKYGNNLSYTTK